jgi:hypothetical protein
MLKVKLVLVAALFAAVGCSSDRPRDVGEMRPPAGDLDSRDRGLQSKDVVDASDTLAMKILALPEVNSGGRKAIVFSNLENQTTNPRFNYDIFIERLRGKLGEQGRDRLFIVENKQRVNRLRNEELENTGAPDTFGQGPGAPNQAPPSSIQPEWDLNGKVSELANRGTSFYVFSFYITNIRTREQIPLSWEVRVAR